MGKKRRNLVCKRQPYTFRLPHYFSDMDLINSPFVLDSEILKIIRDPLLIKIGKKKHIKEVAEGKMRFMPLSYYREGEKQSGIIDRNEGTVMIKDPKKLTFNLKDGTTFESEVKNIEMTKSTLLNRGIYCMSVPELIVCKRECAQVTVKIAQEYVDGIRKEFPDADHVLILSRYALEGTLDLFSTKEKIKVWYGKIDYYPETREVIERVKKLKNQVQIAFEKNDSYSNQREYRIIVDLESYEKNPLYLTAHNLTEPIGIVVPIEYLDGIEIILAFVEKELELHALPYWLK